MTFWNRIKSIVGQTDANVKDDNIKLPTARTVEVEPYRPKLDFFIVEILILSY